MNEITCPSEDELKAFTSGQLQVGKIEEVANHVEQCPSCEDTVANIEAIDDTMIAGLRMQATSAFAGNSELERAMSFVKAVGKEATFVGNKEKKTSTHSPPIGNMREYELLEKIGEGGMGAVYKARHSKLDKIVAIKVLPAEKMQDSQAVARFEREMRAVGKLEHPNIVRAMDAGEVDGVHFLVMEFVRGIDLSRLVNELGPLPIADACELVRQAAVGLDEADDHDMVHRDIKPSNLILAFPRRKRKPVVKILDMGLALLSDAHLPDAKELTHSGQLMGTLDYMAPEQGGDTHNVDIRADIYSLGATLYRLLTGQVIYFGEQYSTPVQKIVALATIPAPPLQDRRADAPAELAIIVHQMLEKTPATRYQTPEEVAEALGPFSAGNDLAKLIQRLGAKGAGPSDEAPTNQTVTVATNDAVEPTARHGQGNNKELTVAPAIDATIDTAAQQLVGATAAQPRPHSSPQRAKAPPRMLIGGGLALLAMFVLLGAWATVFFLQTPNGTLRVEINDPSIEVKLKGTEIVFNQAKQKPITIAAGEKTLVITRDDFTFETDQFILKQGEVTVVKVDLLPGKVQVVASGGVIGSKTLTEAAPAGQNYALQFDGKASHMAIPGFRYDGDHPITLEAWVTPTEVAHGAIVGNMEYNGLTLKIGPELNWKMPVGPGKDDSPSASLLAKNPPEKNHRVHIAGVITKTEERLYINGKIEATTKRNSWLLPSEAEFMVGADATLTTPQFFFNGLIDEVRISNVARYEKDFTPVDRHQTDKHTLALYHFDEGKGGVPKDASGNGHHGKIVGAKWVQADRLNTPAAQPPQPKDSSPKPPTSPNSYALEFNNGWKPGEVDHEFIAPTLKDTTESMTMEFWTLRHRPDGHSHIMGFDANNLGLTQVKTGPTPYLRAGWWMNGNEENNLRVGTETPVHVAFVRDAELGKHRFYLDGKRQIYLNGKGSSDWVDAHVGNAGQRGSAEFRICGAERQYNSTLKDGGPRYIGWIDEVRISSTPRYLDDFTPQWRFEPDEQTRALYHFDEGEGDIAKDASGNGHDGKITGAKWVRLDSGPNAVQAPVPLPPYRAAWPLKPTDPEEVHWLVKEIGAFPIFRSEGKKLHGLTADGDLPDYPVTVVALHIDAPKLPNYPLLKRVAKLGDLESLTLSNVPNLNAKDAQSIEELRNLRSIDLTGTKVEAGVESVIDKLPYLNTMALPATNADAWAQVAARHRNIRDLRLERCNISQNGFQCFEMMLWLNSITISQCENFSRTDGEQLAKRLPNCRITLDGEVLGNPSASGEMGDRAAVDLALSLKAYVQVIKEGERRAMQTGDELPSPPFNLSFGFNQSSSINPTDEQLEVIASAPSLVVLNLEGSTIAERGLKALGQAQRITYLGLAFVPINDSGLKEIASLKSLESLQISNVEKALTSDGLNALSQLPKLRNLMLESEVLEESHLKAIGQCRSLTDLDLRAWESCNAENLDSLSPVFGSVDNLLLIGKGWRTEHYQGVASFKNLDTLRAEGGDLSRVDFSFTEQLKSLQSIALYRSPVAPAAFGQIAKSPSISRLEFNESSVVSDDLAKLKNMARLSSLILRNNPKITDEAIPHLSQMKLKYLTLQRTGITARGVAKLKAALPDANINSDFSEAEIKAGGSAEPSSNTNAAASDQAAVDLALSLGGYVSVRKEGKDTMIKAGDSLPQAPYDLSLAFNQSNSKKPSDEHLKVFASAPSLNNLNLLGSPVTTRGLEELRRVNRIAFLGLSDVKLSDAALDEISSLDSLETLFFSCGSKAFSGKSMAKLSQLPNLTHLTLDADVIDDSHLQAIGGRKSLMVLRVAVQGMCEAENLNSLEPVFESVTNLQLPWGSSRRFEHYG